MFDPLEQTQGVRRATAIKLVNDEDQWGDGS